MAKDRIVGKFTALPVCPTCKKYVSNPAAAPLPYCSEECRDGKPRKCDSENLPPGKCVICGRDVTDPKFAELGVCSRACASILDRWDGYIDPVYPEPKRCRNCGILYVSEPKPVFEGCCTWRCNLMHRRKEYQSGRPGE